VPTKVSMMMRGCFRRFSSCAYPQRKVTVIGAGGGIGQPLSLLLKLKGIGNLSLYDVNPATPGIALDVSHCDIGGTVNGYSGPDVGKALSGADVVVVPAGVPRKPGMTRDDLFNTNAGIVAGIVRDFAKHCPKAALLIISNPVNSTVPIAAEILKQAGVYNPKKLFGVTTLDIIRANQIIAEHMKTDVAKTNVTVIGGHAGITILPLLSQIKGAKFTAKEKEDLTRKIAFAGDDVVAAKGGSGSATLSMAYGGALCAEKVLQGLDGKTSTFCSYVASNITKVPYFASRVDVGKDGIEKIHPIGDIDDFEKHRLEKLYSELEASIQKGIDFVKKTK